MERDFERMIEKMWEMAYKNNFILSGSTPSQNSPAFPLLSYNHYLSSKSLPAYKNHGLEPPIFKEFLDDPGDNDPVASRKN